MASGRSEIRAPFAGRVTDRSGEPFLSVHHADDILSFDEARALADADPMHRDGKRSYTLRRWLINEGSLTVSLGLSGQSIEIA